MPNNSCGNCELCDKVKWWCHCHDRKVKSGNWCKSHEPDETVEEKPLDEVSEGDDHTSPELAQTSAQSDRPGDDQKAKKHGGGRKSRVDTDEFIDLYNKNTSYQEMVIHFNFKSQNAITYYVNKLIKKGLIKPRKSRLKQTTNKAPVTAGSARLAAPVKEIEPQEVQALTDATLDIPADNLTDNEATTQLVEFLMTGADTIVIYRDGKKITIEGDDR